MSGEATAEGHVLHQMVRKVANRVHSMYNYLYYLDARNIKSADLLHFQYHLKRREPIIVSGILQMTSSLSWELMVMWRVICEIA